MTDGRVKIWPINPASMQAVMLITNLMISWSLILFIKNMSTFNLGSAMIPDRQSSNTAIYCFGVRIINLRSEPCMLWYDALPGQPVPD